MARRNNPGRAGTLPPAALATLTAAGGYAIVLTRRHKLAYVSPALAPLLPGTRCQLPELVQAATQARRAGLAVTTAVHTDALGPLHDIVIRAAPLRRWVLLTLTDRTAEVEAIRARHDVVGNLGHELRTPITSIGLIAQALQACADDPAQVQQFATRLAAAAGRLDELADSMLTLALAQHGADGPVGTFDLVDVVAHAVEASADAAREAGIRLVVRARGSARVAGHADQVRTAVDNLISNALHYSPAGSPVRIGVHTDRSDHTVIVSVSDRGIGIAPDDQDRIFERFYRTDKARSRRLGGAGLGLAIVKHTALAHGGSVGVDSRPGAGSTFRLVLPLAPEADT